MTALRELLDRGFGASVPPPQSGLPLIADTRGPQYKHDYCRNSAIR